MAQPPTRAPAREKRRADSPSRWDGPVLRHVLEALPAGAYTCDRDGLITFFNRRAVALWGREPTINDPVDRYCGSLRLYGIDGVPITHDRCWMALALNTNQEYVGREIVVERPDGERRTALAYATPVRDESGRLLGAVNILVDVTDHKRTERQARERARQQQQLYRLTDAMNRVGRVEEVYEAALDGILGSMGADRASILLHDEQGVMRFRAWRGLSDEYRRAVEGHSPWHPGGPPPAAICVSDVAAAPLEPALRQVVLGEGIRALAFIPLAYRGRLLGKFMVYYDRPHRFDREEVQFAETIAAQVSFALDRRASEEKLALYREIVANSNDGIAIIDAAGRYLEQNVAHARLTGFSDEELAGKTPAVHLGEAAFAEIAAALAKDGTWRGEAESRTKRGVVPVEVSAFTVRDGRGGPVCFVGVKRDIRERKRAEQEREHLLEAERAARAEGERASRIKDEFLATLSHELRTPLNAILGWAQVLRSGTAEPAEVAQGVEVIERNARAQTQLIEDLLDMSRIVAGKVRLDVQRMDLSSVIDAALESVRPAAEAKGVALEAAPDPAAGPVRGDPTRLQQVVWNLLTNAIKFTPAGGAVRVALARAGPSHLEVVVSDTGAGIRPEFLPHVFERFRQADGSTTRRHSGLRLGLAIVKHLVELHGGAVRAESAGEGKGSTFIVNLPALLPDPDVARERGAGLASAEGAAPVDAADLSGLKVLVVDDDPDARELVTRMLTQCNAAARAASSAAEALELVERERPDVLVSDIGMPGVDGYELLRRVRALGPAKGGDVPAVALTAFARSEDRLRALRAGYQMHVPKPIELAELLAVVASVAGRLAPVRP